MELFFVSVNQLLFAMTLFHDLLVKNLFTHVTNLICCENEIFETFLRTGLRCLPGSHEPRKKKSCTLIKDGLQELNSQTFP